MSDTPVQLSDIRIHLEKITHTEDDANFVGSAYELQLINKAYQKSAYKYDWPQTRKRGFDALVANVDRYTLQSDFRKFNFLRVEDSPFTETELQYIGRGQRQFAIANDTSEYLLSYIPSTATTAYTTVGSLIAGNAITITLSSVDGLNAGDEIYISDTTSSEFTVIQSVDSTLLTITVKLANTHATAKSVYLVSAGSYFEYQKKITLLSSAGDFPILPAETHLIIPEYAAYLYYDNNEEPDRAAGKKNTWNEELSEAWIAFSKGSTGKSNEMSI